MSAGRTSRAVTVGARRLGCLAGVLALAAWPAHAQWQTDTEPVVGSNETVTIATVSNDAGDRFGVLRGADGRVRVFVELGPGFDRLAADGCPTYVVDQETPAPLGENGGCRVAGREARAALGPIESRTMRSNLLWHLIMGGRLEIRYRLAEHGYRASRFTLIRSGQALGSALGSGVEVLPR